MKTQENAVGREGTDERRATGSEPFEKKVREENPALRPLTNFPTPALTGSGSKGRHAARVAPDGLSAPCRGSPSHGAKLAASVTAGQHKSAHSTRRKLSRALSSPRTGPPASVCSSAGGSRGCDNYRARRGWSRTRSRSGEKSASSRQGGSRTAGRCTAAPA